MKHGLWKKAEDAGGCHEDQMANISKTVSWVNMERGETEWRWVVVTDDYVLDPVSLGGRTLGNVHAQSRYLGWRERNGWTRCRPVLEVEESYAALEAGSQHLLHHNLPAKCSFPDAQNEVHKVHRIRESFVLK